MTGEVICSGNGARRKIPVPRRKIPVPSEGELTLHQLTTLILRDLNIDSTDLTDATRFRVATTLSRYVTKNHPHSRALLRILPVIKKNITRLRHEVVSGVFKNATEKGKKQWPRQLRAHLAKLVKTINEPSTSDYEIVEKETILGDALDTLIEALSNIPGVELPPEEPVSAIQGK